MILRNGKVVLILMGMLKLKKNVIHWYLHSLDISCSTDPAEFFFYSKMPLIGSECFYPCSKNGEILMNLFLNKSDDISLFYLRHFFGLYSIQKQNYPKKWNYGLVLLANYFKCAKSAFQGQKHLMFFRLILLF